jgi:hypothetical protein
MNINQYYEAMLEGRFNPTINLDKQNDGSYKATYEGYKGKVEVNDNSPTYATNECARLVREGVMNGEIIPR